MQETHICPLSHKYVQKQANKQGQVVSSWGLRGKEEIYLFSSCFRKPEGHTKSVIRIIQY